jgi:hypothetical protein
MRLRRALLAAALAWMPALVSSQSVAQPAPQSGDPSFNLVNRSGQTINEIYVSAVTQANWGRDLLGNDVLAAGRSFRVRIPPSAGCQQDVRVVYANGQPEERRAVNTCAIAEMVFGTAAPPPAASQPRPQPPPQAAAANPSFNLVNHGRQPLREVYVSSVREANWGDQRLPQPIQPGAWLAVRLPSGDCVNDVRVVWADGRNEERRQVDTCRLTNLIFQ